jgi:hypothetical protein
MMSSWVSEVWNVTTPPLAVSAAKVTPKTVSVDVVHTATVLVVVDTLTQESAGIAPDAVMIGLFMYLV